VTKKLMIY